MAQTSGREYQLATTGVSVSAPGMVPFEFDSHSAVNYKDGTAVNLVKNHKGRNAGHTIGDEDTTGASMTVLMSEWEAFMAVVAAAFPNRLLQSLEFNMSVNYGEQAAGNLISDTLEGVFFLEQARAATADQNAISMPIPLVIKHVFPGGRRPVY